MTEFTPQESYVVEIQFSERIFCKGSIWEIQRALPKITAWTFCFLPAYENANDYGSLRKFEEDIFFL